MIEKITDQNLERYDSRLKEWCDRKFFEKGNYGKYQTTEEAGAVAFYPAPNIPLEGKVKFSFKETMPIESDKGLENPSTITGISSVKVTKCGKNILPSDPIYTKMSQRGITVTKNIDGSYHFSGTAASDLTPYMSFFNDTLGIVPNTLEAGKTITISISCSDSNVNCVLYDSNSVSDRGDGLYVYSGTPVTYTMQSTVKTAIFRITVNRSATVDCDVYCQIEYGDTATTWEAPADTDYTVSFGSTYYGGEIDLATGVMTVTHGYKEITSFFSFQGVKTDTVFFNALTVAHPSGWLGYTSVCAELPVGNANNASVETECFRPYGSAGLASTYVNLLKSRLDVSGAADPSNPTSAEWLAAANVWVADNPLHFVLSFATPQTVQLTPLAISALPQPDKYTPRLNTVYTDADSVQISYLKSPIRDEYEKTQAILSLGGNS